MRLRLLGAHQSESSEGRLFSLLIDDHLALDAGSLVGGLTLEEQCRVTDVLLTHHHLDHIKDLALFGLNILEKQRATIHATPLVREMLGRYLLNPEIWLDFFDGPVPGKPTFLFAPVEPGAEFSIGEYRVRPVAVDHHAVPVTGYQISRAGSGRVFYTGDTGPGCRDVWPRIEPDLLIIETTFSDAFDRTRPGFAARVGHLTPASLKDELVAFRSVRGYLPRVLVVHVNPYNEKDVRREIACLAEDLDADILVGHEGLVIEV